MNKFGKSAREVAFNIFFPVEFHGTIEFHGTYVKEFLSFRNCPETAGRAILGKLSPQ